MNPRQQSKLSMDSWVAIASLGVMLLTFAAGYGRLSQQVSDLKDDVSEIKSTLKERPAAKARSSSFEPVLTLNPRMTAETQN